MRHAAVCRRPAHHRICVHVAAKYFLSQGGLRLTFRQPRLQKFAEIDSFFAVHRDVNEGEVGPLGNHLSGKWQIAELVAAEVGAYGADLPLRGRGDVDELQRTPAIAGVKLEGDSCEPQSP